jgi:SAM-dependent methyltransferase
VSETIESRRDWGSHWAGAVTETRPDDFLSQVGCTINGQPCDPAQTDLLERSIRERLALGPSDIVLDLCCGNGLVTHRIATGVRRIYGIDFSAALIDVASSRFIGPNIRYACRPATALDRADFDGDHITKVYVSTALQYFDRQSIPSLMASIRSVSGAAAPIFFTDIPDVDHLYDFYNTPERRADFHRRRVAGDEAIGTWWNKQALAALVAGSDYTVEIMRQDTARYGAHYRFDLLARRR